MGDASVQDLSSLDRDVALAWRALSQWRSALARDPDAHADENPLEPVRHVAGKSTLDALTDLVPSAADAPLREGLKRWVFALIQARIGESDEVAWARAASNRCAPYAGDRPRKVSWREAWRGLVAARSEGETALWLDAAALGGPALAEVGRKRASRRVELAHRLGVDHPWANLVAMKPAALRDAASRLIDATEELSKVEWKDSSGGKTGVAAVLHAAVGQDAGEGWPAHLTARWLEDVFRGAFRGLRVQLAPLPAAVGATSFARALYSLGVAVRIAAAPTSTPFALAFEPAFVGAHRFGFVFGALTADARWQGRVLGVGRRVAHAQSRVLARSALLDARLHAARLLLGDDAAYASRDQFDELGARLFGRGLDARLRGAWPAAREDEPARFVALLESREFAHHLRDQFDSDWYRNPRAWAHLQGLGAVPAFESIAASALTAHADRLAREFEDALG
jgi:hypothetical protein